MLEFLSNYGLFFLKTLTIIIAVVLGFGMVAAILGRVRQDSGTDDGHVEITNLSEELDDLEDTVLSETIPEEAYKKHKKAHKRKEKKEKKQSNKFARTKPVEESVKHEPRLFVLSFDGDMEASDVEGLRECVTAVLTTATEKDEVLLKLESTGGYVHDYGFAAAQLERLRAHDIDLTVAVDKVAASGGYMMAVVGGHIIASPFAIIGSIGVIAEIPNFHRVLDKLSVDYESHTAGRYKRTLGMFAQNSDEGRQKFKEELNDTHDLFKNHIHEYREELNLEKVATGEHWHGTQALDLGLVDELMTSDDYILNYHNEGKGKIYKLSYNIPESFMDKLGERFAMHLGRGLQKLWQKHQLKRA